MVALLERRLEIAAVEMDDGEIARDDGRDRIERLGEKHLVARLVETAEWREAGHRVPVVGGCVSRVAGDGALELALGADPVPVLRRLDVRQGCVRFGRTVVEHHGRGGARRRFRPHLRRAEHAVVCQQPIGIGETAVRERRFGIFGERLLEEVQRLPQALVGPLVQVISTLKVQIVRGEVFARPSRRRRGGVAGLGLELGDDRTRHLLLAPERVINARIDRLGPDVAAGARAIDAQRAVGAEHLVLRRCPERRTLPLTIRAPLVSAPSDARIRRFGNRARWWTISSRSPLQK